MMKSHPLPFFLNETRTKELQETIPLVTQALFWLLQQHHCSPRGQLFPHFCQRNPPKDDKCAKLQGNKSSCLHNPYLYDESP